jgi:hypothetical protein
MNPTMHIYIYGGKKGTKLRGNMKRLAEVMKTLITRTFPVPSLWIILLAARLEMIVAALVTAEYTPASSCDRFSSSWIIGHAAPNIPSGSPRLTNAM